MNCKSVHSQYTVQSTEHKTLIIRYRMNTNIILLTYHFRCGRKFQHLNSHDTNLAIRTNLEDLKNMSVFLPLSFNNLARAKIISPIN